MLGYLGDGKKLARSVVMRPDPGEDAAFKERMTREAAERGITVEAYMEWLRTAKIDTGSVGPDYSEDGV